MARDQGDFSCGTDFKKLQLSVHEKNYHTVRIHAEPIRKIDFSGGTAKLEHILLRKCFNLTRIIWPKESGHIKRLELYMADKLKKLDVSALKNLEALVIIDCKKLSEIKGLGKELKKLVIDAAPVNKLNLKPCKKLKVKFKKNQKIYETESKDPEVIIEVKNPHFQKNDVATLIEKFQTPKRTSDTPPIQVTMIETPSEKMKKDILSYTGRKARSDIDALNRFFDTPNTHVIYLDKLPAEFPMPSRPQFLKKQNDAKSWLDNKQNRVPNILILDKKQSEMPELRRFIIQLSSKQNFVHYHGKQFSLSPAHKLIITETKRPASTLFKSEEIPDSTEPVLLPESLYQELGNYLNLSEQVLDNLSSGESTENMTDRPGSRDSNEKHSKTASASKQGMPPEPLAQPPKSPPASEFRFIFPIKESGQANRLFKSGAPGKPLAGEPGMVPEPEIDSTLKNLKEKARDLEAGKEGVPGKELKAEPELDISEDKPGLLMHLHDEADDKSASKEKVEGEALEAPPELINEAQKKSALKELKEKQELESAGKEGVEGEALEAPPELINEAQKKSALKELKEKQELESAGKEGVEGEKLKVKPSLISSGVFSASLKNLHVETRSSDTKSHLISAAKALSEALAELNKELESTLNIEPDNKPKKSHPPK